MERSRWHCEGSLRRWSIPLIWGVMTFDLVALSSLVGGIIAAYRDGIPI